MPNESKSSELSDPIPQNGIPLHPKKIEWREYKLGEVITLQRGVDLPKGKMEKGSYPVAGSNGIIGYHNFYTTNGPGVTIGRSGNIGAVHFYKMDFWAHNTSLYVKDFKGNDEKYIYYFLKTIDFSQFNTGSAVPSLNRNHVHELDVRIPPLEEQKRIASILSSLDDKIDLLRRQNATLEAMAETLFRHHFIENPNPEWKEGKLGDVVKIKYGKDHKKLLDGTVPVFGSGGLMRYVNVALSKTESVLIPRKGTLNNVMYVDEPFWTVDTMFYTEMMYPNIAKFVYLFVKEIDLAGMNVGSAVPSMTAEVLNNIPMVIPTQEAFDSFESVLSPLFEKMKTNRAQIQTLTRMRDRLLQKLMTNGVL